MSVHAWCRDIERDEAVRAAEDGRSGPLPTLEEAIADPFTKTARIRETETAVEPAIPAADAQGGGVAGLRTERVTLEVTHDVAGYPLASWDWRDILRCARYHRDVCESVRVVEEVAIDAQWAERITDERDAAIRERDELRRALLVENDHALRIKDERDAAEAANASWCKAAGIMNARVAELEAAAKLAPAATADGGSNHAAPAASGNVEKKPMKIPSREWFERMVSVDDSEVSVGGLASRVAELESAPAASCEGGLNPHAWGVLLELHDAARAFRDSSIHGHQVRLDKALADAERLLTQPRPAAPAASGAAGMDVAEIARLAFDAGWGSSRDGFNAECAFDHLAPKGSTFEGKGGEPYEKLKRDSVAKIMSEAASGAAGTVPDAWGVRRTGGVDAVIHRLSRRSAERSAEQYGGTVVPLYAVPQAAPGWLTPEERDAVMYLIANRSQFAPQTPHEERRNAACRVCHALLARETPPEVVLPRVYCHGGDGEPLVDLEDVRAALAAAGVTVKGVG